MHIASQGGSFGSIKRGSRTRASGNQGGRNTGLIIADPARNSFHIRKKFRIFGSMPSPQQKNRWEFPSQPKTGELNLGYPFSKESPREPKYPYVRQEKYR